MDDEVSQHVPHRPRGFEGRAQGVRVKSVGEDLPAAADELVEPARDPRGEPLHAAGEPLRIAGLDDQVQVVPLHRKMNEAKALALLAGGEGSPDGAEGAAAAQIPNVRQDPQGYVRGMVRREGRAAAMRDASTFPGGLGASAFAPASPRGETQSELSGAGCHLDSAL
jgi:hypothetical protein